MNSQPRVERIAAGIHKACSRGLTCRMRASFRVIHKDGSGYDRHMHYCAEHLPVKYHGRFS